MSTGNQLDEQEVAAIQQRLESATPGPWEQPAYPSGTMVYRLAEREHIADCEWATDADFIAHARQDVERLLVTRDTLLETLALVGAACLGALQVIDTIMASLPPEARAALQPLVNQFDQAVAQAARRKLEELQP